MNTSTTEYLKRLKKGLLTNSINDMQDYDVLELLLSHAVSKRQVMPLAKSLHARFKDMRGIFDATIEDLSSVRGVNEDATAIIKLMKVVFKLYMKAQIMKKDVINSQKDLLVFLNLNLSAERSEKFLAIYLNSKNEVLGVETIAEGTINGTVVYPRKIIEKAFKHNARSIILAHNHPSGDATPSYADMQLTKNLEKIASAVDVIIHDHIIVGKTLHFSGREHGWLTCPERYLRLQSVSQLKHF